jgi:glycosyltransferase involved in cell wall biosynthesis
MVIRNLQELMALPVSINGRKFDVVHGLNYTLPLVLRRTKKVLTVDDVTPVVTPQFHTWEVIFRFRHFVRASVQNADMVLAPSLSTKNDIMEAWGVAGEKIRVVSLGVDHSVFRPQDGSGKMEAVTHSQGWSPRLPDEVRKAACRKGALSAKLMQAAHPGSVRRKYGLSGDFLLFVGTLEPRKNIPGLLRAFACLQKEALDCKLVIVGPKGWKYGGISNTLSRHPELNGKVVFLGYVAEEDLPAIYSMAKVFIYPSFYEGFGLPPLEAMACGTPVIASGISSMPEVVGNAGILIDPADDGSITEGILSLLVDEKKRKRYARKGLERANAFSWERTARETMKAYEDVVGR